jgi:hypothetical protein
MQKSSDDKSYSTKKGHDTENAQNPEIAAQIRVLLDLYRRFGPISFDHGNTDEAMGELRRELQNPSVFAVSSLPMQAWWRLPEEKMELLKNAREAIVSEYEQYHMLLEEEVINRDVNVNAKPRSRDRSTEREREGRWSVRYLMKEGQWCSEELQQEKFVKTMEVLLSLPLMENG